MGRTTDWLRDPNPASRGQARLGQAWLGWLRFRRNPLAMIGLCIVALLLMMAAFAPLIAPHDPITQSLSNRLQPPGTPGHWLGTDDFGRDIWSRIVFGSRITLYIVTLVAVTAPVFGLLVGTVAYQTYPGLLGQRLPIASMQTSDVDIAQFHNVSVAVEDATPPMLEILEGIDASFRPVPRLHRTQPSVTYVASDNVRVDFLTPNKGSDTDTPRRLAALGTHAEPLRFLDFLIHAPEPAVVLHGAGILVSVPAPERYAVHKLIVDRCR